MYSHTQHQYEITVQRPQRLSAVGKCRSVHVTINVEAQSYFLQFDTYVAFILVCYNLSLDKHKFNVPADNLLHFDNIGTRRCVYFPTATFATDPLSNTYTALCLLFFMLCVQVHADEFECVHYLLCKNSEEAATCSFHLVVPPLTWH